MKSKIFTLVFSAVLFTVLLPTKVSAQSDTLVVAAQAKAMELESSTDRLNITIKNIDNSNESFYYRSQSRSKEFTAPITIKNFSPVSNVVVSESNGNITISYSGPDGDPVIFTQFVDKEDCEIKTYLGTRTHARKFGLRIGSSNEGRVAWEFALWPLNAGWNIPVGANPSLSPALFRSWEIGIPMVGVSMIRNLNSLSFGLGFNWRNYVTTDNHYFDIKEDGKIVMSPYENPEAVNTHSRIKIFSLQVPIFYRREFSRSSDWSFSLGVIGNFNTSASIKTYQKIGNDEFTVKHNKIGQRLVTVDVMPIISYQAVGLYCRYNPLRQLKSSTELDFSSVSVGLILTL